MNTQFALTGLNPFDDPLDRILAEIALSIQLPPSLHDKAKARYEAVRRHLEGQDAFRDQIEHFYPQGSMAIDATISTRGTDDEYDLDIVSQLGGRFRLMEPLEILIELEAALVDYPVQRVLRQTRCVTLFYADKMHLDVTPALRIYGTLDRESHITHAKGPHRSADDRVPLGTRPQRLKARRREHSWCSSSNSPCSPAADWLRLDRRHLPALSA